MVRLMALSRVMGILAAFALANASIAQEWGDLKVKMVFGGDAAAAKMITPDKDKEFCGKHDIPDERLLVDSASKGVRNVILYLYAGRSGKVEKIHPDQAKPSDDKLVLANMYCRFEPHVLVLRPGQTINVTNPDEVGHNANFNFVKNKPQNFTIPTGGEKPITITDAEPAPIPVDCNIHPWMRAYLVVMDHPYVGVSAVDGTMEIKNLPVGKHEFRIYHESFDGALKEAKLGGQAVKPKRNVLEVEIKPGMNDLGVLELPAAAFKK
jgi:plastocyanin